jgi:hypothetical protein
MNWIDLAEEAARRIASKEAAAGLGEFNSLKNLKEEAIDDVLREAGLLLDDFTYGYQAFFDTLDHLTEV